MDHQAIVFLPGFMCDHRLFSAQETALRKAGFDCLHGDLSVGISIKRIAEQILRYAPKRFAVAGLSMGGLVAFELYRLAPHRITHMALLNTTARADTAGKARKTQLKRVAAGELDLVLREELKPQYLHPANRTPDRLQLLENMGSELGKHVFCSQTIALASRSSYLDLLARIDCPTAIIAGADDTVCPLDRHQEIASGISRSQLHILERCGHISTLEQPDEINTILLALLEQPAARLTRNGNAQLKII